MKLVSRIIVLVLLVSMMVSFAAYACPIDSTCGWSYAYELCGGVKGYSTRTTCTSNPACTYVMKYNYTRYRCPDGHENSRYSSHLHLIDHDICKDVETCFANV